MLKKLLSNRAFVNILQETVYELTPPILRDQKWFCWLLYFPFFREKTKYFFDFRENTHRLSDEEYAQYYRQTSGLLGRETDIGPEGIATLTDTIKNRNVLEVGCGSAYLAKKLAHNNTVTAVDIAIAPETINHSPNITFHEGKAEELPFADNAFETVICTHTLEHVLDFEKAVAELRRVAAKELHIIVPLQRPAKYTPDLHISFFPYPESFLLRIKPSGQYEHRILDRDLYYLERYDH